MSLRRELGVFGATMMGMGSIVEIVARGFPLRVHGIVALGAMTAMLGVLLNLLLGLSRVFLAMARRSDMLGF
jgi:APA family basic amino acid/polyamine antiporter